MSLILLIMDSKIEYYPNGLVIEESNGELIAEWKNDDKSSFYEKIGKENIKILTYYFDW